MSGLELIAAPPRFGVAENTSDVTPIGTSIADVTGLVVSFTVGARPVLVEAKIAVVKQLTSTGTPLVYLKSADGATQYDQWGELPSIAANATKSNVKLEAYFTTPGAYTVIVRAVTTAATITIGSTDTARSRLRWREL